MSIIGVTNGSQLQYARLRSDGVLIDHVCAEHDKPGTIEFDVGALLLDTPADTIGIRPIPGHRRSWSSWRAQCAIIAQARRLDAAAEVDVLSLADDRQTVVVLNRQVPDEWLSMASSRGGVRFQQVLSAARAVARYGPHADACCLYVVRRGQRVRHLLCRDRVAYFTRELVCEDVESALAALDETLEYLSSRDALTENILLAYGALFVGEQEHLVKHPAFADHMLLAGEAADSAVQDVFLATAVRGMAVVLSARAERWWIGGRDRGLSPRDPWLADRRARRRLLRYRYCVGVAAVLVLLSAGVTVLQAADFWQQWQTQQGETARLSAAVVDLKTAARDLHPRPVLAATLLEARHRLSATTQAGSLWIPTIVASVLSRFEAITLQQISWHADNPADNLAVPSDDATDQARWQVSARDSVPMADNPATYWQVLMSGRLDQHLSLREQQAHFEAFVTGLRQRPGVRRVSVRLSPVEAWRFAPAAVSSTGSPDAVGVVGKTGDDVLSHDGDTTTAHDQVFELSMHIVASDHD